MDQTGDRRFVTFLALSVALHALWLALPLRTKVTGEAALPIPLTVQLAPLHEDKSVVVTRHLPRGGTASNAPAPWPSAEPPIEAAPSAPPAINLDAAFATARSLGREAPPTRGSPPPPVTIESAIARATQADEVIETRGTNGEHVTRTRHSRCVTPIYVPHFLEGKTMLTQCEALEG
jgi:hypothetical protein